MRITNKEKSISSFFNLYSDQFRELKEPEKKDNPITVQDIIDINTEMTLCKSHVNFAFTNETQTSNQFLDRDVNIGKQHLEKIIKNAYSSEHATEDNNKFSIASKIICNIISNPIFTYQNDTTAISVGLYYLYKNEIELNMSGIQMDNFLKSIKEDINTHSISDPESYMTTSASIEYILKSYVCDLDKDNTSHSMDDDRDLPGDVLE